MRYALLLLLLCSLRVEAQQANYRGKIYTPSNFSRANWCSCRHVCVDRAQWAATTPRVTQPVAAAPQNEDGDAAAYAMGEALFQWRLPDGPGH